MVKKTLQHSLTLVFLICSLSGVHAQTLDERASELSQEIARNMETGQKRRIAVLEFTDLQGQVTNFGRYLAEELITRLYGSNKFTVVERQLLNKVIAEQKLSLTGVVDPDSAKKLGNVLGVYAIVSGTIADRGDTLKINARLIDTQTGEVFSAAATEMVKDKAVLALLGASVTETKADLPSGTAVRSANRKITSDDFTFELDGCRREGQRITCEFSVINNSSEDRGFSLYGSSSGSSESSRLIDSNGNEFYPSSFRLGSTTNGTRIRLGVVLVPKIATNASLTFLDPSLKVTSINLLRIAFHPEGKRRSMRGPHADYADFKNVPVQ